MSGKETKASGGRVKGRRKEVQEAREDEAVVGGLGYIRKVGVPRVVWVTVVGLRDEAPW